MLAGIPLATGVRAAFGVGASAPLAAGVLVAEDSSWDRGEGSEQGGEKWPVWVLIPEAEPAGLAGTLHVGCRETQEARMMWHYSVPQCPHQYGG